MRQLVLISTFFLLAAEGAGHAQNIAVSVRDGGDNPVYSTVYFRRSSSSSWDRLGVTDPNGQLKATLACAPGTEVYADPFPGEYWNSPETACRPALPLRVAPRRRPLLISLQPIARNNGKGGATRSDLAYAVGRAEAGEWRGLGAQSGKYTALHAYLASSNRLSADRASLIRTNLLNESSGFYSEVDIDNDGILTNKEISRALSASPNN